MKVNKGSMLKLIIMIFISQETLLSQMFSDITASEVTVFDEGEPKEFGVFIDESSLLAWQDSERIPLFTDVNKATNYCQTLNLYGYIWRLPTQTELISLSNKNIKPSMNPNIKTGRNKAYMAIDGPEWDNTLHYGFNYAKRTVLVFKKASRRLHVRCVASLE